MTYSNGLRWKIYIVIFTPLMLGNLAAVIDGGSVISTYYDALMAFDPRYFVPYAFNLGSAVINALALVPLFLYVFRIRFLEKIFWQGFFILRIIFDVAGHAYEAELIKSIFYSHAGYALSSLALAVLLIIPSYLALFRYAFRQEKVFSS